jgi:two-component system NtrC family sensor kinase
MGTLLASVAHELNNPLAVVKMQVDLLGEEVQDPDLQEQIADITQATERCIDIVQNFLTLARRNIPQRGALALNTVVDKAVHMLGHALEMDQIVVHQQLAADLPSLEADRGQLQQVLFNLLLNAQQALRDMPEPRQITVTTRYDSARALVMLEVADTGPGIPVAIQSRIFEPFYTTKPVGLGTGLGLALCRSIIEAHEGTLRLVSQPDWGAVFQIELPVHTGHGVATRAASHTAMPQPVVPTPTGALLIVEDEVGIATGLARLLRRDGYSVETVMNGRQALDKLASQHYDLILCDLRMPELDGPGFYRAVATRYPGMLCRFVFLTGDTLSAEASSFLRETGAPLLVKPFSASEGRRIVQQALQAQDTGRRDRGHRA